MFNPDEYVALVPKMNMGVMVDLAKASDTDLEDFKNTHIVVPLRESIQFVNEFPQPREFITANLEAKRWLIENGVDFNYPDYYEGYDFIDDTIK